MKAMQAVLACLPFFWPTVSPRHASAQDEDWVYVGKGVRLVSFQVDTDEPGADDIFNPGQNSGFIVLGEDNFTITSATPFGCKVMEYSRGSLRRLLAGSARPEGEEAMPYRSAMTDSLDQGVCQGLGDVVEGLLAKKGSSAPPTSTLEKRDLGGSVRLDFGKSWRALKRVTWLSPNLKRKGLSHRTVCVFKVILPGQL